MVKCYLVVASHDEGDITAMVLAKSKWEAMQKVAVREQVTNFIPVRVKRISKKLFAFVHAINKIHNPSKGSD